jgi:fatty-acyl-CoA synthase
MSQIILSGSAFKGATDVDLLQDTIGQTFDSTAEKFPYHPAIVVKHQNISWNYKTYQQQVNSLALGLLAQGVKVGDRVGIWAPNCIEWSLVQFATAKIGAIMVCINPAYRLYELEYALNKVQCKVLILADKFKSSNYIEMIQTLVPELASLQGGARLLSKKFPYLELVIRTGDGHTKGMHNFSAILANGSAGDKRKLDAIAGQLMAADVINIQFTSGTTGSPKGAMLSHLNILNNGKIIGDGMLLTEQDKLCIPVPLYHCFGMVLGNLACITHGSAAVFPSESFDPLATLQTVESEGCTALHGVPTMFIAELEHPDFKRFDLTTLRTGIMAGSPCPVEVMKKVIGTMHMEHILIGYGQTELSPVSHMTAITDTIGKRVSTVGKPGPHLEVKIVDDKDNIVAVGERGEICTRGYSVMQGYWDDAERTAETINREGWLYSGDIGIMDSQGYVQVVGRIKDMIIRGGENIYPREVEEFLYTHPAIQDVQVFGIPDQKYGEQIAAWIILNQGANASEQDIRDFCAEQITYFKIPRYIRFVDEFPMTVTGKMQKFKMREEMIETLNL